MAFLAKNGLGTIDGSICRKTTAIGCLYTCRCWLPIKAGFDMYILTLSMCLTEVHNRVFFVEEGGGGWGRMLGVSEFIFLIFPFTRATSCKKN